MLLEFKALLKTKELWLPALGKLVAGLSATQPGKKIESELKERLKFLREPAAKTAFFEAFTSGITRYSREKGRSKIARSAARIMARCVEDKSLSLDFATVVDQIFDDGEDQAELVELASRQAVVLEDACVSSQDAANALRTLICGYLRPAFRAHPYFTQHAGFMEIAALLREIRDQLTENSPDLEQLALEYRAKIEKLYEIIPMQGISPKIQNRTIGIRMEDIFIPLKLVPDNTTQGLSAWAAINKRSVSITHIGSETLFGNVLPLNAVAPMGTSTFSGFLKGETNNKFSLKSKTENVAKVWGGANLRNSLLLNPVMATPLQGISLVPHIDLNRLSSMQWFDQYADAGLAQGLVTIESLLSFPSAVVRGDPGSGKSTMIHYIAWALASGKRNVIGEDLGIRVPVVVRAIEFGEDLEKGLVASLEEYLTDRAGRFAPLIKSATASGDLMLLVDGLDEVSKPPLRKKVKECVEEFIADPVFALNRVLITTRIVGYERTGLTGRFKHFTLSELDDEQIRTFIQYWYGAIQREMPGINAESEAQQLLAAMTGNDSIHKMARNPLLLTIIALIKWQGRSLPDLRVMLYDAAAQTLISSWPIVQRSVKFDELFIREWLAPVALHILSDRTGDLIDEYSLMDELVAAMQRLKSKTPIEAKTESQQLLDSISEHSGFLLPRGTDPDGRNMYGFLHQTFAEFLAACLLAGRWEDKELNLRDYAHDPYWREVLLLMAGHLGTQRRAKAGHFIEAVRGLRSCPYEDVIRRDLLLACEILGDGVPAGPPNVIESLLSELLSVWRDTPIRSLRADVESAFQKLRGTEYAGVLARLATNRNLSAEDTVVLAQILGANLFHGTLIRVLKDRHAVLTSRLAAAELLYPVDQGIGDVVSELDGNEPTRFGVARVLINLGHSRGIPLLMDILKTSRVWILASTTALDGCRQPAAARAVAALLNCGDPRLEANAAALLTRWEDKRGPDALARLALSADSEVAGTVWTAVRDAKPGLVENEKLVAMLQVPSLQLRLLAAHQLALRDDQRGVEALVDLLSASDLNIRLNAAIRLDERDDGRALPAFVKLLSELDNIRQLYATRPLAKHGVSDSLTILRRLLTESNLSVRIEAASQLLESGDKSVERILLDGLSNGGGVASAAFQALVKWGKQPLSELSAKVLGQPDLGSAWVVMEVLSRRKEAEAADILTHLLDDNRFFVRAHAAELLITREEPVVLEALKRHLDGMLQETVLPADLKYPAPVLPPAESAYQFIQRHLTPAGVLPDWTLHS